jgi:hypothetical protein
MEVAAVVVALHQYKYKQPMQKYTMALIQDETISDNLPFNKYRLYNCVLTPYGDYECKKINSIHEQTTSGKLGVSSLQTVPIILPEFIDKYYIKCNLVPRIYIK